MSKRLGTTLYLVLTVLLIHAQARAGVVSPDLSVIGQPFMRWTNDLSDPSPNRWTLAPGELEVVYDAYLNPYAKGYVVTSLTEEGLELEEGYFNLLRGLPIGLALKGGKYRVGFGKLNSMHPHAVPFADRPRVLAAYLPGDEAFNETGFSLSERVPLPGTFSLTATADVLQGDSFRLTREATGDPSDPFAANGDRAVEARPAFAGNLSGFGSIGERSGYELSISGTGGTNNVAAGTISQAYDAAGKLKLWTADNSYLLVQGELLATDREVAAWNPATSSYTRTRVTPLGGYVYADYNFSTRYDAGVLYERYQQPTTDEISDQVFGAFVGLALMEETTSFRLDWNHFMPGAPAGSPDLDAIDTVTLRVIFSMGPHKAHQF